MTAQPDIRDEKSFQLVPDYEPVRIMEFDLAQPLPALEPQHALIGQPYQRALALIRIQTYPVQLIQFRLSEDGSLSAQALADIIYEQAGDDINTFLTARGLSALDRLPLDGIADVPQPEYLTAPDETQPMITVIICTRERPDSLRMALNALVKLDYPDYEILVVDNAPKTDTVERLVHEEYPAVRYVQEPRPGLSHARNCGIASAKGEIIAFTDDDVAVDPLWLKGIAAGFRLEKNVACVTGLVLPARLETPAQDWFEQFGGFNKGFTPRIYDMQEYRFDRPLYPYSAGLFGTGANMAFRRDVLLEVIGDFDVALGAGTLTGSGEDLVVYVDLIMRGYQIVYEPTALVHHYHRQEYETLRKQIYNYGVGFTAFLTAYLLHNPLRIPGFALRIPYGLYLALSPTSFKNAGKQSTYPDELTGIERRGMMIGPWLYLRSRWQQQRKKREFVRQPSVSATL